ncbi:MAG: hypothetical protein WC340_00010 [Kiritimatiellia bacterium]
MFRLTKWMLVCVFMAAVAVGHSAESPQVGIVISWNFNKDLRSVPYQQNVWHNLLRDSRMFVTDVVEEAELEHLEALRKYRCIILPLSRLALTGTQMTNLLQYVHAGGKLIRDQTAVSQLGRVTDKGREIDASPAAKAAVASFWRSVGGVEGGKPLHVQEIRFVPERGVLAEFLPAVFTPVEALCDAEFKAYRSGVGYRLAGAVTIAEAYPETADNGTAPPEVVVALGQYGAGKCLSLGINVRGLTGLRCPMAMYRDFMANLRFWIVE